MNYICEPYLPIQFTNKVQKTADSWLYLWTLFDEYLPVFWTLFVNFIRWISASFLNLIYELYLFKKWQIHDFIYELYSMNKNWQIYSMDICRFFEPYLWTVFIQKMADSWLYLWTLFDEYLPVFEPYLWTVFIRWISAGFLNLICIGEYSSQIRFKKPVDSWLVFIQWISQKFYEKYR